MGETTAALEDREEGFPRRSENESRLRSNAVPEARASSSKMTSSCSCFMISSISSQSSLFDVDWSSQDTIVRSLTSRKRKSRPEGTFRTFSATASCLLGIKASGRSFVWLNPIIINLKHEESTACIDGSGWRKQIYLADMWLREGWQ